MTSADQALQLVLEHVGTLGVERVSIRQALGRVLASELRSPRDVPGFDNSAMDGYAVKAQDIANASESSPTKLRVLETIAAGTMPRLRVEAGTASRIMTGAALPGGADTIVPVERTGDSRAQNSTATDETVDVLAAFAAGSFVRPRAEDLREGEAVMAAGRRLSPSDLGAVASLNRAMLDVYRMPRVAIVSTGDELVDVDQVPTGSQVVNSSMYALAAAVAEVGAEAVALKVARDNEAEIRQRFEEALAFDVVLSTGGVSVGRFDHVKKILDDLGMRQIFHGVAQKPGRPLKFGLINGRPVFGLPGNPVSTMVCFYLYARPALLKMAGRLDLGLPRVTAKCAVDIRSSANITEFVRVKLERRDDELHATPTGSQGSGILSSLSRADGLLIAPAEETQLKSGSQATVLLLRSAVEADSEAGFEERQRRQ